MSLAPISHIVNHEIALCSWQLWKFGINSKSILRKVKGGWSLDGSCTEMIYGHLEREHPRTTVATQVHFKGSKVLIGKQLLGTPFVTLFSYPRQLYILWTMSPSHAIWQYSWARIETGVTISKFQGKNHPGYWAFQFATIALFSAVALFSPLWKSVGLPLQQKIWNNHTWAVGRV